MTRRLSDLSFFAAGRPPKIGARSGEAPVIWAVGCLTAAPQKSHKSASRGAPTRIPRTRRHSTAHPGTPAKIETKTSPEQAKRKGRRLLAVPIGGGQGQDRTVDLPLMKKVCRSRCHRVSIDQSAQLERIHPGIWADTTILTPVPRCAGECRFVRVTGVLDASWTRTCVALVFRSSPGQPSRLHPRTRPCNTGTRARPRLSTPTIF